MRTEAVLASSPRAGYAPSPLHLATPPLAKVWFQLLDRFRFGAAIIFHPSVLSNTRNGSKSMKKRK